MLNKIQERLMAAGLVASDWSTEVREQADLVALYREYADGDHRLLLTTEQKSMMNISDERLERYNDNYCEMVVEAISNRMMVTKVEAVSLTPPPAPPRVQGGENPSPVPSPLRGEGNQATQVKPEQEWIDNLLADNRFDALQAKIHKAAFRDGETYVMVQYSDDKAQVRFAHELAYDGDAGIIPVWDSAHKMIVAAVKIWWEGDARRVNIYYQARTEKYTLSEAGELAGLTDADGQDLSSEDTIRLGKAPGVPVIAFTNQDNRSVLVNVIPLQDSLNRTLVDMVMTATLTAFSFLVAVGFEPDNNITPGKIFYAQITDGATGAAIVPESEEQARALATMLNTYRMERIEAGDVEALIKQAEFLIEQIGTISATPLPGLMGGSTSSGEALKQREVRLLSKIEQAQTQMGNAYEDLILLAHLQHTLFGANKPPALGRLNTRWKTAEIRSDMDILAAAKQMHDWGFVREALRLLGQTSFARYDEADLDRLMSEKARDVEQNTVSAAGSLPGFEQFDKPPAA